MLGGVEITAKAREHAREMLKAPAKPPEDLEQTADNLPLPAAKRR
jgi:hypothetical protein